MKINTTGCTRIVLVFDTFVIKIPNFLCSWTHFLKGLLANMAESKTWKWNSGKYDRGIDHLLCPVKWCSIGGWILIMERAELITDDEFLSADISQHIKYFKGDDSYFNYGKLNGRIVKIDYGQLS